ncbi:MULTISPECIES: WbuC family cupin fold metalloprotein [Pseudoalteromonas]|uniref:WbuC family cupin fold metalloprotein n=1 Tax=Pseudoalteromonas TaxID=53246 RepID=UPI0003816521|nr:MULTISPECIES: WbuC family cupin fold metalloprotein [Pseudoalteromonas]MDP4488571.1 WbuC family cupin fold metalloprotein [Pseudoalteromonas piscicida]
MSVAIFNDKDVLTVDNSTLDMLKARALASPTKRFRLCCHRNNQDPIQEMIIVLHRSALMTPHRHPQHKSESYHLIEGEMEVFIFDDKGQVSQRIPMSDSGQDAFMYRLSAPLWHLPIARSEWVVYHECYVGPFDKDIDVEYAPWAPSEDKPDELQEYYRTITGQ